MKLKDLCEKETLPSVKTLSAEEIAKHHNTSTNKIKRALEKGMAVELEHTKKKHLAREIALDHLKELPDYYDRLEKVEKHDG